MKYKIKVLAVAVLFFMSMFLLPLVSMGQSQYNSNNAGLLFDASGVIVIPRDLNISVGNFLDFSPEHLGIRMHAVTVHDAFNNNVYSNVVSATVTIPADTGNTAGNKKSMVAHFVASTSTITRSIITPAINVMDSDRILIQLCNIPEPPSLSGVALGAKEIIAASFAGNISDGTFGIFASAAIDSISIASMANDPYIQLGSDITRYGYYWIDTRPWRKIRLLRTIGDNNAVIRQSDRAYMLSIKD